MSEWPQYIQGVTTHARRGDVRHGFRYGVDYVLINPRSPSGPKLFSRNRFNVAHVRDRDHGGKRGAGRGVAWAEEVFAQAGLDMGTEGRVLLLTQPRILGHVFNPVSFWLAMQGDTLRAVIAEVNNTFGDRHSYLCHLDAFRPIRREDAICVQKVLHVSPFQDVAGQYQFNFDITQERIAIRILHENGPEGVIATLRGPRRKMTNRSLLAATLRRPAWAMRVLALIHWQAVRLKIKGAMYRTRPTPPKQEISS